MTNLLSRNETGRQFAGTHTADHHVPAGFGYGLVQLSLSPTAWLTGFVLVACLCLLSPILLPAGSYYWDISQYPDAAWRIANGQIPTADFFTPAGPLEYYGFAFLQSIFPGGHILLLANWSILLVALPVLTLVMYHAGRSNRLVALALLLPFLIFAAYPYNSPIADTGTGATHLGIDHRHAALLLYILFAAILFVRDARTQIGIVSVLLLALFFTRVSGFALALALIAQGVVAGRILWRTLWFISIVTTAGLLLVDMSTGILAAYLEQIAIPSEADMPSLFGAGYHYLTGHKAIVIPALGAAAFLLWDARSKIANLLSSSKRATIWRRINGIANLDTVWLLGIVLATGLYESHNSNGLGFILLWPLFIAILNRRWFRSSQVNTLIAACIVLALAPGVMWQTSHIVQTAAATITDEAVQMPEIGLLGAVKAKPDIIASARTINTGNTSDRQNQSRVLTATPALQIARMMAAGEAVRAIRSYEEKHNTRFKRLMTLDSVDPLPAILGRIPVRHISVHGTSSFNNARLLAKRLRAAETADAILAPRCAVSPARSRLVTAFQPVLQKRAKHQLSPCWDIYLRPARASQ